jgi:excisionase family DNA binding protein
MPRTVTIMQAAKFLQVSRRTIYHWLKAGKLQYVRTAGGTIRILTASLFRDGNVPAASVTKDS